MTGPAGKWLFDLGTYSLTEDLGVSDDLPAAA